MHISYLLDKRVKKSWLKLVRTFSDELEKELGEELLRVMALPSPDDLVYESNVLIVVREARPEVVKLVSRLALMAQERVGVSGLNFLVVSEREQWAQKAFEEYRKGVVSKESWLKLVRTFSDELEKELGEELLRVMALPSPDDLVYESNVLIVVREARPEVVKLVSRLALMAQERVGVSGLNFLVVSEREQWAQKAFEEYRKGVKA